MRDARISIENTEKDSKLIRQEGQGKSFDFGHIRSIQKQNQITGIRKSLLITQRKINDLFELLKCYRSLSKSLKVARHLIFFFQEIFGGDFYPKVVEVGGEFYSFPYTHSWGSPQYKRDLRTHLYNHSRHTKEHSRLLIVLLSITNQCPLRCEHCFEWGNLNKPNEMSLGEIEESIQKIQSTGAISIHLSGGEPMLRMEEMLPIVKKYNDKSAFWVLTSGVMLTGYMAHQMKKNGVSIVSISLDHHRAVDHDRFRGQDNTFEQAMNAAKHCIENDLVCMLSLCITKENVNHDFLMHYMNLAKDMGVAFVQILEPRSIGHYKGKKVELEDADFALLEEFYLDMNFNKKYHKYPIIVYHGYQNRRIGCFSSGKYSLYIDSSGEVMTCTFCRRKEGNILEEDLNEIADRMIKKGCGVF